VRDAEWQLREPELYAWSSNDGSISIASRDRDGDDQYELIVHNAAGEQVDELSSERLAGDRPARWKDALAELHLVARRSALIEALPTTAGHTASAS